jgi:hypothetical protein
MASACAVTFKVHQPGQLSRLARDRAPPRACIISTVGFADLVSQREYESQITDTRCSHACLQSLVQSSRQDA